MGCRPTAMNRWKFGAMALALAAGLAGCGGGGGGSPSGEEDLFDSSFVDDRPPQSGATATYADPQRQAVWQAVNDIRRQAGLGDMFQSGALDVAAQAHSDYVSRNASGGPFEVSGRPLFAGFDPDARAIAAGYAPAYIVESTASTSEPLTGARFMELTMGAPYHRMRVMTYAPSEVGIGFSAVRPSNIVIDLAYTAGNSQGAPDTPATVWPTDGATGTPLTGCCEDPRPVQLQEWGYPVSVQTHERKELKVDTFTLTDADGKAVASTLLNFGTDPNLTLIYRARYVAFLMPLLPLTENSRYTASFNGTINGKPYQRTWSFTTGARPAATP